MDANYVPVLNPPPISAAILPAPSPIPRQIVFLFLGTNCFLRQELLVEKDDKIRYVESSGFLIFKNSTQPPTHTLIPSVYAIHTREAARSMTARFIRKHNFKKVLSTSNFYQEYDISAALKSLLKQIRSKDIRYHNILAPGSRVGAPAYAVSDTVVDTTNNISVNRGQLIGKGSTNLQTNQNIVHGLNSGTLKKVTYKQAPNPSITKAIDTKKLISPVEKNKIENQWLVEALKKSKSTGKFVTSITNELKTGVRSYKTLPLKALQILCHIYAQSIGKGALVGTTEYRKWLQAFWKRFPHVAVEDQVYISTFRKQKYPQKDMLKGIEYLYPQKYPLDLIKKNSYIDNDPFKV